MSLILSCLDMNYAAAGAKIADSKLDVSQRVLVPQEWFTSLNGAYDERINLRLFLSCLNMNYAHGGAKTANDFSQNFLN